MKVYKYRSEIIRDINTVAKNQIYISSKEELNDPCEALIDDKMPRDYIGKIQSTIIPYKTGIQFYDNYINELRYSIGVYSTSAKVDNELLWAYYANGHRGFCIEYDLELLCKHSAENYYMNVIQVNYENELPALHFELSDDVNEVIYIMHGYKSQSWAHEHEIRIISNKLGLVDINAKALTGIYLGTRTSEIDKQIIKNALKGMDINLYQMKLAANSYSLQAESFEI